MDAISESRVRNYISEADPRALYILFDSPGGVLVENIAPLLEALEDIYRRLLILRLDREVLRTMLRRQSKNERLSGVGRSINSRYSKAVLSPSKQIDYSRAEFGDIAERRYSEGFLSISSGDTNAEPRSDRNDSFVPTRVQLARSKMSSPGFIEILGDPTTMQALIALLGSLILVRGQEISKTISLRGQQPEVIRTLTELGYSNEEVKAVRDYLSEDLDTLIDKLEAGRAIAAPGDDIDPSEVE